MKEILLGVILLLHSINPLLAQDASELAAREQLVGTATLERELISDLDLRLKLNSIIMEVASQVDREHPGLSPWQDGGRLAEIMREKSNRYADFYLERIDSLGPQQKNLFKKAWQAIKWENMVALFKRTTLGIQSMFRKKGFGIAIAVFMGFVSEYTVPIILTNIGLPWLIPLSAMTPYQILYSTIPQKITELRIRLKVRNSLGGSKAYQAYMKQEKATREALKAIPEDQILIPITDAGSSQVDALALQQSSWFKSFINRMGLNDKNFSYATLRRFLETENLTDEYITEIMKHPRLKRWQKAARITIHLQETMTQEQRIAFRARFDKNFIRLHSFNPWDGFEKWTKELLRAKSIEEINSVLFEVPRGTPTRLILEVWEQIVIPHLNSETSLGYFQYRKLVEDFASTRAKILSTSQEAWSLSTHQELLKYVGKSLGNKAFSDCQNDGQTVLRFLLAN